MESGRNKCESTGSVSRSVDVAEPVCTVLPVGFADPSTHTISEFQILFILAGVLFGGIVTSIDAFESPNAAFQRIPGPVRTFISMSILLAIVVFLSESKAIATGIGFVGGVLVVAIAKAAHKYT